MLFPSSAVGCIRSTDAMSVSRPPGISVLFMCWISRLKSPNPTIPYLKRKSHDTAYNQYKKEYEPHYNASLRGTLASGDCLEQERYQRAGKPPGFAPR